MCDLRMELFVSDVETSIDFYTRVLQFDTLPAKANGSYRPLERGSVKISLQASSTLRDGHPLAREGTVGLGLEIVLEVDDVETFCKHVDKEWTLSEELTERPWGLTDFRVIDPDGYYWRPTSR